MAFTFAINGHTYTSDPTNTGVPAAYHFDSYNYMTAMGNLCGDLVALAAAVVSSAAAAAASAATAVSAPGTQATSATSFTLATGSNTFTLAQAGKLFPLGSSVSIARTSDPTKVCYGTVTAFADPDLTVNVTKADVAGGPFTDWTIALSGAAGAAGAGSDAIVGRDQRTSNAELTGADKATIIEFTAGGWTQTVAACGTLGAAWFCWPQNSSAAPVTLDPNGGELVNGRSSLVINPGDFGLLESDGAALTYTALATGNSATTAQSIAAAISATAGDYVSTAVLSPTQVIAVYLGASNYVNAVVLDIATDGSITVGTPLVANNETAAANLCVCAVSATQAVVTWREAASNGYGRACTLNVAGSTITAGARLEFNAVDTTAGAQQMVSVAMDSTHVVVVYQGTGNGSAVCLSISGTTLSAGAIITNVVSSGVGNISHVALCKLSATKLVTAWRNTSGGDGQAGVLTLSGTTLSAGTTYQFSGAMSTTPYVALAAINDTSVFLAYRFNDSNVSYAELLTASGTTLAAGSVERLRIDNGKTLTHLKAAVAGRRALVTYHDGTYIAAAMFIVSDKHLAHAEVMQFNLAAVAGSYTSCAFLGANRAIVSYKNGSTTYGNAVTLDLTS